jgi:hypothetical protein
MAVPDDREDRGPDAHSTDVNTDPSWMNGKGGAPVLGDGVKANIDDLTGFSRNMDKISTNYSHLGQTLTDPLERMLQDAFPGGAANGLAWSTYLLRLAGHNAGQIEQFFGYSSMGMRNVAMAAQAVANAYGNADETGAATMGAIEFAFGDKSKAPPGIPRWILDQIPTWEQFTQEHPEQAIVVPDTGPPPGSVDQKTEGNTTTITVHLPDGRTMTTKTTTWAYYGATGKTETVTIDGKEQSSTQTSTYNGQTQTTKTETVYDSHGKSKGTHVVSRTDETVTQGSGGSQQTDRKVTTYTYDDHGKKTEFSNQSSVAVGPGDNRTEPALDPSQDPALKREQELRPDHDKNTKILAPGPLDGSAPSSHGSGTVSA